MPRLTRILAPLDHDMPQAVERFEHRLQGFQSGKFACRENALALTKIQEAMHWLHSRTRARVQRGVEGTHER